MRGTIWDGTDRSLGNTKYKGYIRDMDQLPKYQDLIKPLLSVLAAAGEPLTNAQIEKGVVSNLDIPESLSVLIHTGNRTELQYRLAWARTKAKSSGWIESPHRETWRITLVGEKQI